MSQNTEPLISIDELRDKARQVLKHRQLLDEMKSQMSEVQEQYEDAKIEFSQMLDRAGMERYDIDGSTISISERTSVRVPADESDRQAFFDYLRSQGIYERMITVNSRTLNSWYRGEEEAKARDGIFDFQVPGINQISTYRELTIRKR